MMFVCFRPVVVGNVFKSGVMKMRKIILGAVTMLCLSSGAALSANIVETAASAGTFKTLIAAAKAAGLAGALADGKNLTVFAPTDEAFAKLPKGTVESLLLPENKAKLAAILSYHVVGRELAAGDFPKGATHIRTIKKGGDRSVAVKKSAGGVTVDGANVIKADIRADNGIIHVIDAVLLPKS
jgi:uncharacterized surface protein with fasciclin (FAS1) repeats